MAKTSKKQTTPKTTEIDTPHDMFNVTVEELASTFQPVPNTPEQSMGELIELSQELGLYEIEGNPLVKGATTMPVEAPTEALEPIADKTNATVAKEPEMPSGIATEPLNATEQLGELLEKIT